MVRGGGTFSPSTLVNPQTYDTIKRQGYLNQVLIGKDSIFVH